MRTYHQSILCLFTLISLHLPACGGSAQSPDPVAGAEPHAFQGIVVQVVDGDSVVVRVNSEYRMIALYGIDCPENVQAYGNAGRYWVNMLVHGEVVRVVPIPPEKYREIPALIYFSNDRCLNRELIMAGLAWVDRSSCLLPECRQWRDDEARARKAGVGLWKDKDPMPPWKWRQLHEK